MKLIRTQKGMRYRRVSEYAGYWQEEYNEYVRDFWHYMTGNR